MNYAIVIERGPTGFGAWVPDLPGCVAVARSREEVARLIEEAIEGHIAALTITNQPVPLPTTSPTVVDLS